jgi:hypothetical protein
MQRPLAIYVRDPATGLTLRRVDPIEDSGTGEADMDVDTPQLAGPDDAGISREYLVECASNGMNRAAVTLGRIYPARSHHTSISSS